MALESDDLSNNKSYIQVVKFIIINIELFGRYIDKRKLFK